MKGLKEPNCHKVLWSNKMWTGLPKEDTRRNSKLKNQLYKAENEFEEPEHSLFDEQVNIFQKIEVLNNELTKKK